MNGFSEKFALAVAFLEVSIFDEISSVFEHWDVLHSQALREIEKLGIQKHEDKLMLPHATGQNFNQMGFVLVGDFSWLEEPKCRRSLPLSLISEPPHDWEILSDWLAPDGIELVKKYEPRMDALRLKIRTLNKVLLGIGKLARDSEREFNELEMDLAEITGFPFDLPEAFRTGLGAKSGALESDEPR